MANVKITDLTAYTNPASTDVLPIVDVGADVTKKVSIADLLENAGSGTAAAPGIAFDGDSDTGIYRPGANQVAISTNGTGRLFVESTGSTRIEGTGGPSLIIKDTDSASGASTSYLRFWGSDAETGYIGFVGGSNYYINNSRSSGAILFRTEDTERARIDSSGYLRLSTNSGGIQFNGDTAAANALDDYEEGNWTPTVTAATYVGGSYTKIGNRVIATAYVKSNGGQTITISTITGLPFNVANNDEASGAGSWYLASRNGSAYYDSGQCLARRGTTTILLSSTINQSSGGYEGGDTFTLTVIYYV